MFRRSRKINKILFELCMIMHFQLLMFSRLMLTFHGLSLSRLSVMYVPTMTARKRRQVMLAAGGKDGILCMTVVS
ncbi:hypothetical protein BCR42DRAFT_416455 [Absidia repens]|uniref:Uncharacterized protein n=1 Tax=Absidia repens TaxID=90262 RepID=A0A1X2IEJ1_9FUNG|nr:hypothetical protein BCR42DRAFT_416455 [Absidia repens]